MAPQREWFEKDYYKVLGVPEGAPEKDVSRAYKKLAKQFHPDANPGNKEAEERFKEISAAYDVVGDTEKRKEYDEVRRMVASGRRSGRTGRVRCRWADLQLRGRRHRRPRRVVRQPVRRRRAARPPCAGGSATRPGSRDRTAPRLRRRRARHHLDGAIPRRRDLFDVRGFRCRARFDAGDVPPMPRYRFDRGRPGTVLVLARCVRAAAGGARSSRSRARPVTAVASKCARVKSRCASPPASPTGNASASRAGARREPTAGRPATSTSSCTSVRIRGSGAANNDLTLRLPVTFAEAASGADVKVPTLDGQVTVRIPPGTPSGKVLRVRGKGAGDKGDLLVTVDVQIPVNLSKEQREAVEALAKVLDEDPRASLFGQTQNRRQDDGA